MYHLYGEKFGVVDNVEVVPLIKVFGSIVMLLGAGTMFCDASVSDEDRLVKMVILLVLEDIARVASVGGGGDGTSTSVAAVEKGSGFFNCVPPSSRAC